MLSEKFFFELLQVAIGKRQSLSVAPSASQWSELFVISKKQALVAVAFRGVSKLIEAQARQPEKDGDGAWGGSLAIDETLYLRWLGLAAKVAQRNRELNAECARVCQVLAHDGMRVVVLKGQGNLQYYPEDLRDCRVSGDIDVLLRSKAEPAVVNLPIRYCLERARRMNVQSPHVTYHHADWAWEGLTNVEVHYRAVFLYSPLRNWRLQHWLEDNMPWGFSDAKVSDGVFPVPPVTYNAIYQLLHIYKHLFEFGIGLRQLLDYYFVLRALHIEQEPLTDARSEEDCADYWRSMQQWAAGMGVAAKSNEEIMRTLSRFGLRKFAAAVMYVLQTVFEAPLSPPEGEKLDNTDWQKRYPWMICEPDEKEGKFLLSEIMKAGNFGKYDDRIKQGGTLLFHAIEKTKHSLRLFSHYPEEVLCGPFFRVCHGLWRRFELWRY